jgi:hypothetical protein
LLCGWRLLSITRALTDFEIVHISSSSTPAASTSGRRVSRQTDKHATFDFTATLNRHHHTKCFRCRICWTQWLTLTYQAARPHHRRWVHQNQHPHIAAYSHYRPSCLTTAQSVSRNNFTHKPYLSSQVRLQQAMAPPDQHTSPQHHTSACLPQ